MRSSVKGYEVYEAVSAMIVLKADVKSTKSMSRADDIRSLILNVVVTLVSPHIGIYSCSIVYKKAEVIRSYIT